MLGDSPGGLTPDPLVALEEGGAAQPHNPPQRPAMVAVSRWPSCVRSA